MVRKKFNAEIQIMYENEQTITHIQRESTEIKLA